jgi:hypothetical protein
LDAANQFAGKMADREVSLLTLMTLAEMHHSFGLIGIVEYEERCRIAHWLYGDSDQHTDPRYSNGEEQERERNEDELAPGTTVTAQEGDPNDPHDPGYLRFLFNGWVFTKADVDPYPSTPHGHWQSQNRKWPKLDPYNGRAFEAKHRENISMRLKKFELKILWSDEKFKDFCRGHLIWYSENFPYHHFRVRRDRLLRFPSW